MTGARRFGFLTGVVLLLVGTLWASTAAAAGLLLAPSDLAREERDAVRRGVAEARRREPEAFVALGRVVRELSGQRSPRPAAARSLRRLGATALYPMLEALVLDAAPLGALADDQVSALAVGMLEALGRLRDGRAAPLLRAAFARAAGGDPSRAAAEALGRSCDDPALALLRAALRDARRAAAIDGLGQCRRAVAAELLAAELDASVDEDEARHLAVALGRQASSWAWKALGPAREQEGLRVRRRASQALVRGYLRHDGSVRAAHRLGLRMAAHPELRSIVRQQAALADEASRRDLEAIAAAVSSR